MYRISPISLVLVSCLATVAEAVQAQLLPAPQSISSVVFVDADAAGANNGSSWADAFTDLQDALVAARSNSNVGEIWVAEGTYHPAPPDGGRHISFELVGGVGHYGGFAGWETQREQRDWEANVAVLSGDLNDNDTPSFGYTGENSYHVVEISSASGTVVLDGFRITRGKANRSGSREKGGGVLIFNSSVTVRNSDINHNYAKFGPGVCSSGANLTLVSCELHSNRFASYGKGGGLYVDAGVAVLRNSSFHNHAGSWQSYGGAVYAQGAALEIDQCAFFDNLDVRFGAGVSVVDCASVSVRDCDFCQNWSSYYGGGLHADGVYQMSLERCSFIGNQAGAGGGVSVADAAIGHCDTSFYDCVFADNMATDGGAVYSVGCDTALHNCTLIRNFAGGDGGAVCDYEGTLRLASCLLAGNSADNGGGVWNSQSLFMTNCLVAGNSALSDWGAGGGLYTQLLADPGQTLISNCTIAGNRALNGYGGGVFAGNSSEALVNCILWGNSDLDGVDESAQIHRTTDMIDIDYCDIQGLSSALGGSGNIGADPGFVSLGYWHDAGTPEVPMDDFLADGDYRLTAGSPCADAGDNTTIPADVFDLDADGDVGERVPLDLAGAFRFVDDPLASDVGVADPPNYPEIVDMGAYEHGSCVGDLDGDGEIGLDDLAILLGHYGGVGVGYENGDLDRDGDIGLSDLGTLLAVYGQSCQ